MARIDVLPSIDIIRGLKGILDFYLWRGLPCVRAWPQYRPARQTDASLAAALLFGAVVKSYALLADTILEAYREDALDQPRTARDIMVTGVYGNLHEASMSDFLDALIICRDSLVALTALLDALHSVNTDELVVRVEHSVLPDDAATHTRQLTMLAALQKIDDLQDALESKALDRLLVRGMDQLFSYKSPVHHTTTTVISGAGGFIDTPVVGAGVIWHVTTLSARDNTSAVTNIIARAGPTPPLHDFWQEIRAFAAGDRTSWAGHVPLNPGDAIRVYFAGALAGDSCTICVTGYVTTLET